MNLGEIQRRVSDVAELASDPERAHGAEDELYEELLNAIATGKVQSPMACARAALKTKEIEFERWYA